ncbi:unnamed protein product [Candida verbasci]|uniref:Uncharacterized protein n=1 Tax=Candida verbasci TaxID=1227364 RepID=A0A9W4XNC6_9ASCO|nr:unnamed protein product [Candida verbasci]
MWVASIFYKSPKITSEESTEDIPDFRINAVKGKIVDGHPMEDPKYKDNLEANFKMHLNGDMYLYKTKIVDNVLLIPKEFDKRHIKKIEDLKLIQKIENESQNKLRKLNIKDLQSRSK